MITSVVGEHDRIRREKTQKGGQRDNNENKSSLRAEIVGDRTQEDVTVFAVCGISKERGYETTSRFPRGAQMKEVKRCRQSQVNPSQGAETEKENSRAKTIQMIGNEISETVSERMRTADKSKFSRITGSSDGALGSWHLSWL